MIGVYEKAFLEGLKPEEKLSLWQWSDKYRYLSSKASAESGRYRTERTPYMRSIMEAMSSDHPCEEIVVMKSAQIGFSEVLNNYIGYVIDHSPGPMLLVLPNIDMAKRNSKTRIDPLIQESPTLRGKVSAKKSRDSGNAMLNKEFTGGVLVITGANSATGLRSMPVRFLLLDEVDGFKADVSGEGSPIELAKARTRTFNRRKIIMGSTPTIAGMSPIEAAFENSTQQYYYVPCPKCSHMQTLRFPQIRYDAEKPLDAVYICEDCEGEIHNWQKTGMLTAGQWRKLNPDATVVGFHINALYSPVGWYSWGEMARDFIEAKKDPEKLKSFINTVLGETWKEKAEVPDWNQLYARRDDYKQGTVPDQVAFLTAGCDVQQDRLEVEVVGWCKNKVSYSIDYRVLYGDTSTDTPWLQLQDMLSETFPRSSNENLRLGIIIMAIDSGYNTQTVYNWVRKYPMNRVMAVKGVDRSNVLVSTPAPVDVTLNAKKIRRGLKIWPVGVSLGKSELYGWLRQPVPIEGEPDPLGFCHFPQYGEEYFKMLTAEQLVTKTVKGYRRTEWHKTRDRNEALDIRIYARAAAFVVGMDRFDDMRWDSMMHVAVKPPERKETPGTVSANAQPRAKTPKRKRKDSIW